MSQSAGPLSAPKVRMTAAATPISRARSGSISRTAWAASTKIRCASGAEPMLTSMCPRRRATSQQQRAGSVARPGPPPAAPARGPPGRRPRRCARPRGSARPAGRRRWSAPPPVRRPPAPRRTRRAARHGTRPARGAATRSASGPSAAQARCQPRGPASPTRPAPRPGPGGHAVALARWRPGRSPSAPAGDAADTEPPVVHQQPGVDRALQRVLVQSPVRTPHDAARRSWPVSSAAASSSSALHRRRQPAAAVQEGLLDPGGEVQRRSAGRPTPSSWAAVSSPGSSSRASGLPPVSRDEPFGDLVGRVAAQPGGQEGAGCLGVETGEDQLGQAGRLEDRRRVVARREHHHHPVRPEPSGAEQQRSRAGRVQPVCVVDDAQHEALLGSRRQQRQGGHTDQEGLDSGTVLLARTPPGEHAPGAAEDARATGSADAAVGAVQRRRAAPRPRAPGCAATVAPSLSATTAPEQRGLADPRLASYDDAAGRPVAGVIDERRQERPLGVPADQHMANVHAHRAKRSGHPGILTGAT